MIGWKVISGMDLLGSNFSSRGIECYSATFDDVRLIRGPCEARAQKDLSYGSFALLRIQYKVYHLRLIFSGVCLIIL